MALVSHKHKFIYLKTEKTGSTSVEMALQTLCAPPGTEVSHYGPAIVSDYGIVGARGDKYTKVDESGFQSHMPAKKVAKQLGRDIWSSYTKVSSLRNPYDKAVSWFWFMARKHDLATSDPVEDFRAFIRDKDSSGYFRSRKDIDWRVTHVDGRDIIDHYIKLENLEADFAALFTRLGIAGVTLDVPKVKAETRKKDPLDVPDYFDAATADLIRKHWGWIFEAGGYSLDPADAGRASKGSKLQIAAPETASAPVEPMTPKAPAPAGGVFAAVKRLLAR